MRYFQSEWYGHKSCIKRRVINSMFPVPHSRAQEFIHQQYGRIEIHEVVYPSSHRSYGSETWETWPYLKTIVLKWLIHTGESIVPLMFTVSTLLDLYLTTIFCLHLLCLTMNINVFSTKSPTPSPRAFTVSAMSLSLTFLNQTALEARRSTGDYVEWGQFKLGWKKYWAASDHVHRCIGDHMGKSLGAKMSYTLKGSDRCQ